MAKPARRRYPLVVAVIVAQGYASLFSHAGEEEVCGRYTAVIAICRQCQLGLSRPGPKLVRHRNRLEGSKTVGYLMGTMPDRLRCRCRAASLVAKRSLRSPARIASTYSAPLVRRPRQEPALAWKARSFSSVPCAPKVVRTARRISSERDAPVSREAWAKTPAK